jgi:hypothetical protein
MQLHVLCNTGYMPIFFQSTGMRTFDFVVAWIRDYLGPHINLSRTGDVSMQLQVAHINLSRTGDVSNQRQVAHVTLSRTGDVSMQRQVAHINLSRAGDVSMQRQVAQVKSGDVSMQRQVAHINLSRTGDVSMQRQDAQVKSGDVSMHRQVAHINFSKSGGGAFRCNVNSLRPRQHLIVTLRSFHQSPVRFCFSGFRIDFVFIIFPRLLSAFCISRRILTNDMHF